MNSPSRNVQLSFVRGYHPATPVPEIAVASGCNHRFAVIIYDADLDGIELFFPCFLYKTLLTNLSMTIPHDSLQFGSVAKLTSGTMTHCLSCISCESEDAEPFDQVIFTNRQQVRSIVQTEWWTLWGGPLPYSDSYTFAIYTSEDLSFRFFREWATLCDHHKLPYDQLLDGDIHIS